MSRTGSPFRAVRLVVPHQSRPALAGEPETVTVGTLRMRLIGDPSGALPGQTDGLKVALVQEHRLIIRMLWATLQDLQSVNPEKRADAIWYVLADQNGTVAGEPSWPFSFAALCEHLNVDPVAARRRLAALGLLDAPIPSAQQEDPCPPPAVVIPVPLSDQIPSACSATGSF